MIPKRNIIIPGEISSELKGLVEQRNESQGVLLYSAYPADGELICPVFNFYKTGEGTPGHVSADERKLQAINSFLRQNSGVYSPIIWHSHSRGTVETFGDYFARNFSQEDLRVINKRTSEDPLYLAMLSTPIAHLVSGKGDVSLTFINDFEGFQERNAEINRQLGRFE
ncbi:hypothetical protein KA107_03685 [Candidatus Pacearchaeota archaeon]|nr:hypothetical protein [Candidatus Pacearchaeota archaeon]